MEVKIAKSPIPIMWIDTSLIIILTKLRKGEISSSNSEKERINKLHELLYQKVSEKKLLCPKGDQEEEIIIGRRLINESREIQVSLSLGINFKQRGSIQSTQINQFMKAYIDKENKIILDYKDAFSKDPIKKLKEMGKFIISVNFGITEEHITEVEAIKKNINSALEPLRQKNISEGITFKQQLEREYKWLLNEGVSVFLKYGERVNLGIRQTRKDYDQAMVLGNLLVAWDKYNSQTKDLKGFIEFINSDYYKSIPTVDISARLWAHKMTSKNPIESGDAMDIDQISAILPYCNFVFTDKRMKNLILNLDIDDKYKTKVYCMKDLDELVSDFSKL